MIKAYDILQYLTDSFPYRRRRPIDWIAPASFGLGVGVVLGVGVGLLVAPSSGEQTRRRLRDGAQRMKERAMSAAREAKGERVIEEETSFSANLGEAP